MLREEIGYVLSSYVEAREIYSKTSEIPELQNLLSGTNGSLPRHLKENASLPYDFKVEGSIGKGIITHTPWLGIFDREITISAQEGYYIVYLFRKDMTGVYLSLNQGWTQYNKRYSPVSRARNKIREVSLIAQDLLRSSKQFSFEDIDLRGSTQKAKGYEEGNICSAFYPADKLPSDNKIISDLWALIGVYRELKGMIGKDILRIYENITDTSDTELEYQNQAQNARGPNLPDGPIEKGKGSSPNESVVKRYERDPKVAAEALANANYQCELNPDHKTFIKDDSPHQYMEAHHLVPVSNADDFKYSLDVPENIVSLCPICHRAIHLAEFGLIKIQIEILFKKRREGLKWRGIDITLDGLLEYY